MNQFDDETLVAYLDGELDGAAVERIELALTSDPELGARLEKLRGTWDLLDDLPIEPPTARFAVSTIEMAAISTQDTQLSLREWVFSRSRTLIMLLIPLLFLVGFAGARRSQRLVDQQIVDDLPVLVDWRSLSNIDSVEWLNAIISLPELTEVVADHELHMVAGGDLPDTVAERREWVRSLNESDRNRLRENLAQFEKRDETKKALMRELAETIYSDPERRERTLRSVRSYEAILQDQSISQRTKPIPQRLQELVSTISGRQVAAYEQRLSEDDQESIRRWAEEMQVKYERDIGQFYADATRNVAHDLFMNSLNSPINVDDFTDLAGRLSPRAQRILDGLGNAEARSNALTIWIHATATPRAPLPATLDSEALKRVYLSLPPAKLDAIDLMPQSKAIEQLRAANVPN